MGLKDFSFAADGTPSDAMISPAPATLTHVSDTRPHQLVVMPLPISRIPKAMRNMGWNVSASLMERWFASSPWAMPDSWKHETTKLRAMTIDAAHIDESIVSMRWALSFPRCAEALEALKDRWDVQPAAAEIVKKLLGAGWDGMSTLQLGNDRLPAKALDDACAVNYRRLGSLRDTLDDMYGALGRSNLKLAVIGNAFTNPTTGRRVFHVEKTGTYIKDHYDFNGTQYLGLWTEDGVLSKAATVADTMLSGVSSPGMVYHWRGGGVGHVFNQHFRNYRENQKKGGDFLIYSDVHWENVDGYVDLEDAIRGNPES
jgi:hypothetical protein